MKYMIVSSLNLEGLTSVVNERLVEGWRPLGGPFIAVRGMWIEPKEAKVNRIAQALVIEEDCKVT